MREESYAVAIVPAFGRGRDQRVDGRPAASSLTSVLGVGTSDGVALGDKEDDGDGVTLLVGFVDGMCAI